MVDIDQLRTYVLILEEYINSMETEDSLEQSWEDFKKAIDELKLPAPTWPVTPIKQSTPSACPKCGLRLDQGPLGYCCPISQCPTGLGGSWSLQEI